MEEERRKANLLGGGVYIDQGRLVGHGGASLSFQHLGGSGRWVCEFQASHEYTVRGSGELPLCSRIARLDIAGFSKTKQQRGRMRH